MDKSVIKDIGIFKNRLLSLFLQSPELCELLLGAGYTDDDVYGKNEVDDDYGIVYKQIFPYLYIAGTQTEVLPYLCFEADIPAIPYREIKELKITIWCCCHKDCMNYSKNGYLGTRVDIMADMVERQLRESDILGIGKIALNSVTYLNNINDKYYGRQLLFTIPAFKINR